MENRKVLYLALNLFVVVVVASVTSFLATRYYIQVIGGNTEETRSNTSQNNERDPRDIAKEETDLKNRIQNSNEIGGTVVEVGTDYIKIQPSGEILGNCSDQVFISSYLRDRTIKITSDTRILKLELASKKEVGTKPSITDIKNGDYVMVISKDSIGTTAEFTASIIQLPL